MSAAWGAAGLACAALVALGAWRFLARRRAVAEALGDEALVRRLTGGDLRRVPRARLAAVLLAALALAAALADPRWGDAESAREVRGGTLVMVLDASASMLARDARPSRMEVQRALARSLARDLPGSAVGVVVFAGRAYALAPPTSDRGAVELYLDALDPQMVTQTGSSLSAAIRQALVLLVAGREEGERAGGTLVLLSDGDSLEDPEEVRKVVGLADRAGIPIHTVGIGSPEGAPVPDVDFVTGAARGFLREPTGEVAVSRLNEPLLREIASSTGGSYVSAASPDAARLLAGAAVGGSGEAAGSEAPARYGWFAALALLLLLAESLATLLRREER